MPSWMVASITAARSSLSERTASRSQSYACGVRTSRSNVHASELAVVSCPASTSVSSSSRSSWSVSGVPSSSVVRSSIDRMSVRSARSGASRRLAITA